MSASTVLVAAILLGQAVCPPLAPQTNAPNPFAYGMGVHYGTHPSARRKPMASQIAAAGFGFVRTDFYRAKVIRPDGSFDFSVYDDCVSESEAAGLRVLPILRDKAKADPAILDDLDGWRRFVEAFVRHYGRGHFPVVEVWNEPNGSYFWTNGDADSYFKLLKVTYEAVKSVDPQIRVAFGGTCGVPENFIRRVYALGGRAFFDVMNVHPYMPKPDGMMIDRLEGLRRLMSEYGDAEKPIWITEIGWPTHKAGFPGGHLLKAGLSIAQPERRQWRAVLADTESSPSSSARSFCEPLKAALPAGSTVDVLGPEVLKRRISEGLVDLVVYPMDETYPAETVDAVVDFVKGGGVLVDFGGCPMYKAVRPDDAGGVKYVCQNGERGDWRKLRVEFSAFWLDPALPESGNRMHPTDRAIAAGVKDDPNGYMTIRYLTAANMKAGDEMIPLLSGRDRNGNECVSAAVYRYGDWKGAVVICANNDSKLRSVVTNDEMTQASYLVRTFALSTALGIESTCLYEYMGEERDPYYSEHHFGVVHKDFSEKPAYRALKHFTQMRPSSSKQIEAEWRRGSIVYPQWMCPDGTVRGIAWIMGLQQDVELEFEACSVRLTDMFGRDAPCEELGGGRKRIVLTETPLWFEGARLRSIKRTAAERTTSAAVETVESPDGRMAISFVSDANGMRWKMSRDGKDVVCWSKLGLVFAQSNFPNQGRENLCEMKVVGRKSRTSDVRWKNRLSRQEAMRDRYHELRVELEETEATVLPPSMGRIDAARQPRRMAMEFRAYDEGVAFRYVIPEQPAFAGCEIAGEQTEWRFAGDPFVWASEYESHVGGQEGLFARKRMSELDRLKVVGMPVLVEADRTTVALTEAALRNWAGAMFRAEGMRDGSSALRAELSPLPDEWASVPGVSVVVRTPAASPWRVVLVGDDETDLLRKGGMVLNLNPEPDPSIDFSWVKPGVSSWDWWVESNNSLSTEQTERLIDFAAEMGWPYHTIDGGWYGFARRPNRGPDVELEPRRDFDLPRILRRAKERNVGIWVWIHWMTIDDIGVEEAFSKLEKWGIVGVKTDFLERQDQWMVNWCEKVCRIAARHHLMVNFHGAFKPTGTERTWPNNVTREGIRGNEMNIFDRSVDARHCLTLPFTRFLIGPGDFTPGGFGNVFSRNFVPQVNKGHRYGDETDRCPHWAEQQGTRAHALAQCVVFDSPLMTLCDWPERYRDASGVALLRGLPTVWRRTIPLSGRCGERYEVVREAFDGSMYYAAMTVKSQDLSVRLDFLGDGEWNLCSYEDDPVRTMSDAKALVVASRKVTKNDIVALRLCDEGGAVLVFKR